MAVSCHPSVLPCALIVVVAGGHCLPPSSFVQSAIRHGKAEAGKVREEWQARGLSRVKLHDDLTVEPLCPAALHGLVRFMLEVALTTALEQRATLLESLREALKVQEFAVKARSFLREGIFLHKLAGKLNMPIQVTRSSEANANPERADLPTDHPNELTFEFNIMQFVDNFAQPPPGISEFSSAGARVLLLPRDFCEQHVRALCVNYAEKVMIAFQVRGLGRDLQWLVVADSDHRADR